MKYRSNIFRNGRVHVTAKMCGTCIFRPGNLMNLPPGRVEDMVARATRSEGAIPCHTTTYGQDKRGEAVCRGFYERHATAPLQIAARLGFVSFQDFNDEL